MSMIMKEIELVCNKYSSILNENIQQHIDENENNVEEFVQNLEFKINIWKIIREKDGIWNYFNDDTIYQWLSIFKQNAQISLNQFQYPSLYNECQTYNKKNKHGLLVLSSRNTSTTEIEDFRKHFGRYAAIYLIIKQIEIQSMFDNLSKLSSKKVICLNINDSSTYSKENIAKDPLNNSIAALTEGNGYKEGIDNDFHDSSILNTTLSDDTKNRLISNENKWLCKLCHSQTDYDDFQCRNCGNYGPHYQMWRCEKCTFINNKTNIMCRLCFTQNVHLSRCACHVFMINNQFDQVCEKCDEYFCKNCQMKSYIPLSNGICSECRKYKWVCPNKLCKYLNAVELPFCEKCFAFHEQKQDGFLKMKTDNGEIILWQCSSKTCLKLNEQTIPMCIRCENKKSSRDLQTCFFCGWNKMKSTTCVKCRPI